MEPERWAAIESVENVITLVKSVRSRRVVIKGQIPHITTKGEMETPITEEAHGLLAERLRLTFIMLDEEKHPEARPRIISDNGPARAIRRLHREPRSLRALATFPISSRQACFVFARFTHVMATPKSSQLF
jgi:hypothetical protein